MQLSSCGYLQLSYFFHVFGASSLSVMGSCVEVHMLPKLAQDCSSVMRFCERRTGSNGLKSYLATFTAFSVFPLPYGKLDGWLSRDGLLVLSEPHSSPDWELLHIICNQHIRMWYPANYLSLWMTTDDKCFVTISFPLISVFTFSLCSGLPS